MRVRTEWSTNGYALLALLLALALGASACTTGAGKGPDVDLLGPPSGTWVGPSGTLRFSHAQASETGQFELRGANLFEGQWAGQGSTQFEIIFARGRQACRFSVNATQLIISDCALAGDFSRSGQDR